jgi:hypothetical protein
LFLFQMCVCFHGFAVFLRLTLNFGILICLLSALHVYIMSS